MKKLLVSGTVVALVLLIVTTRVGWASFPRTEAGGSFITTYTTIHSETEDKFNTIIDLSSIVTYTGTLEGTSTLQGTLVVSRDGSATFRGIETFTGLVDEIPGTLTFKLEGNSDLYQAIQIKNIITNGTGGLSNLQGQISKVGIIKDNGLVGTYAGQINHQ